VGRPAKEDRQAVLQPLQGQFLRGNGSRGGVEQGLGLFHVQGADLAGIELCCGDSHAFLLELEVLLHHGQSLLGGANKQIGPGHIGDQGHHDAVVVGHAGIQGGRGRFDLPPKPAPDVGFPGEVEAPVVKVVPARVRHVAVHPALAAYLLLLGVLAADGNHQLLPGLQHPQTSRAQG
jgi:hypothetical protein